MSISSCDSVASSTRSLRGAPSSTTRRPHGRGFLGHSQRTNRVPRLTVSLPEIYLSWEMRVRRVVIALLAAALLVLPASSDAGSGHGGHGGGGHGFHGHGFHGHGFHGHGFHGRGFVVVGPGCCWGPWWW